MRHASLFSGIGAPELAAHWLGWENAFHCEINPFCKQVLKYWFNNSTSYDDITKTDFRKWQGKIDVLTGGFPCQPFSVAGKRKGTEDNRYLWPEFKRAIREIRPPWVVGENVAGILSMVQPGEKTNMEGLPSSEYTVEQEFVVETICKDLEAEGYDVQPMVIPACAVGAPHRRDRVWFIAHNNSFRLQKKRIGQQAYQDNVQQPIQPTGLWDSSSYSSSCGQFHWCSNRTERSVYPDKEREISESESERHERECWTRKNIPFDEYTNGFRLERRFNPETDSFSKSEFKRGDTCGLWYWENFPTQPPICGGDDGISELLDLDSVYKGCSYTYRKKPYAKWRTEAIKAYGNAMVPQVIFQIYKFINEIEKEYE